VVRIAKKLLKAFKQLLMHYNDNDPAVLSMLDLY